MRWRQMSLAAAFGAWVQWHQEQQRQQGTLNMVLQRWAHGHASHAFMAWQHWAQERHALRITVPSQHSVLNVSQAQQAIQDARSSCAV